MKVKFTKLAALLLAGVTLFATGCTDYEVDIQKNADAIASAKSQIEALQATLTALENTHAADVSTLNNTIKALEDALKGDIKTINEKIQKLEAADENFKAQIKDLQDNKADKAYVDAAIKELVDGEIARLKGRVEALETAMNDLTKEGGVIDQIKAQITALQNDKIGREEFENTKKQISDAIKVLNDLTAGFPEGQTIKQYVDAMEASLKDYVNTELKKYATLAQLEEVKTILSGRLDSVEGMLQGFEGEGAVKKYIDAEVLKLTEGLEKANQAIEKLQEDVAAAQADIEQLKADFLAVKGAIRSLVFVPEVYVDGVEAILVNTFNYSPLTLEDADSEDEIAVAEDTTYLVSPVVTAKYHVIPSNADLDFLAVGDTVKFVVRKDDPFIVTRAAADDAPSEDFSITGIYQGRDTTETDVINIEVKVTGKPAELSLITVVALQLTKDDETYTSDYATVFAQDIDDLRIADPTNEEDAHYRRATEGISETDDEAYIDTIAAWTAALDTASCDHQMAYDQEFDLNEYVIAHFIHNDEQNPEKSTCAPNPKTFDGLGFTWKFELVKNYDLYDPALITLTDGVLKCKDGNAINMTPIVRVTLLDGEDAVQIAYVKVWVAPSAKKYDIIWSKNGGEVDDQFVFKCEGDTVFADSVVLNTEVYSKFPITKANFHAAYPTFVDAVDPAVDTLGTVEYVDSTGVLQWILTAEELWPIASDPNHDPSKPIVIKRNVAFEAMNGAQVVIELVADVKPVAPYQIPSDKYIKNYWDLDLTYARYNVATPDLGETDSTKCVFHNNINAAFVTDDEGVIDLTGIGEEGLEVSDIKYFFCDDMTKITKVGDYTVTFTIEDGEGTRIDVNGVEFSVEGYNTILKAKIDTVEAEIAYICNDADEKEKTPNVVVLVKDPDPNHIAKKLLNTDQFYVLLGAKGMICGEEGFEVNLWWKGNPSDPKAEWLDHFQANYIQPVKVTDRAKDEFIDAVDFGQDGSFITLKDLIAPHDWRLDDNYPSGYREFGMNEGDQYYNYWKYYGIFKIFVDVDAITCDFEETDGKVPVTVDLKVLSKTDLLNSVNQEEAMRNPDGSVMKDEEGNVITVGAYIEGIDDGEYGFLTYRNNGTAVKEFNLFVPVTVQYGWGIITTDAPIIVPVNSTIG